MLHHSNHLRLFFCSWPSKWINPRVQRSLWHSHPVCLPTRSTDPYRGPMIKTRWFSLFTIYINSHSLARFTDPLSLLFHVQLWNSHPARRHLTPVLTSYANRPKNTEPGRQAAIFVNSTHKDQHSHWKQVFQKQDMTSSFVFFLNYSTCRCVKPQKRHHQIQNLDVHWDNSGSNSEQ